MQVYTCAMPQEKTITMKLRSVYKPAKVIYMKKLNFLTS